MSVTEDQLIGDVISALGEQLTGHIISVLGEQPTGVKAVVRSPPEEQQHIADSSALEVSGDIISALAEEMADDVRPAAEHLPPGGGQPATDVAVLYSQPSPRAEQRVSAEGAVASSILAGEQPTAQPSAQPPGVAQHAEAGDISATEEELIGDVISVLGDQLADHIISALVEQPIGEKHDGGQAPKEPTLGETLVAAAVQQQPPDSSALAVYLSGGDIISALAEQLADDVTPAAVHQPPGGRQPAAKSGVVDPEAVKAQVATAGEFSGSCSSVNVGAAKQAVKAKRFALRGSVKIESKKIKGTDPPSALVPEAAAPITRERRSSQRTARREWPAGRDGPTVYACMECDEEFKAEALLLAHSRTHVAETSSRASTSTGPGKEKKFTCRKCMKTCKSRRGLLLHVQIHVRQQPFHCAVCGKGFTRRAHLATHARLHTTVDEKPKPFVCSDCGKAFTRRAHLATHAQVHNTTADEKPKPFVCTVCGKALASKSNLAAHTRLHTGEKPFVCEVCGKAFNKQSNLNRHARWHRSVPSEVRRKSFTRVDELNQHAQTHTDQKRFPCEVCEKSFTRKDNLDRHAQAHADQKLFKCKVCGKGFKLRVTRKFHMRVHAQEAEDPVEYELSEEFEEFVAPIQAGEKRFDCEECGLKFTRKENRDAHLRRHRTKGRQ